jgi:NADH-quinone oxidoreductase subunit A
MFLNSYLGIFLFFSLSSLLSFIIFSASFLVSAKTDDLEKITAYECGFSPFEDSRNEFDVKFYIVAILFLIFDLEISFLFPFSTCYDNVKTSGLLSMCFFLFILTIGFLYEWQKGALDWD